MRRVKFVMVCSCSTTEIENAGTLAPILAATMSPQMLVDKSHVELDIEGVLKDDMHQIRASVRTFTEWVNFKNRFKLVNSCSLKFPVDQNNCFFAQKCVAHFLNLEFKKSCVAILFEDAPWMCLEIDFKQNIKTSNHHLQQRQHVWPGSLDIPPHLQRQQCMPSSLDLEDWRRCPRESPGLL